MRDCLGVPPYVSLPAPATPEKATLVMQSGLWTPSKIPKAAVVVCVAFTGPMPVSASITGLPSSVPVQNSLLSGAGERIGSVLSRWVAFMIWPISAGKADRSSRRDVAHADPGPTWQAPWPARPRAAWRWRRLPRFDANLPPRYPLVFDKRPGGPCASSPSGRSADGGTPELVPQHPPEELAGLGVGEGVPEFDDLGRLGRAQPLSDPRPDLLVGDGCARPQHDHGPDAFAPLGVGYADDGGFRDRRVREQRLLDLAGRE